MLANHHRENKEKIYSEALEKSGINEKNIDAIAISQVVLSTVPSSGNEFCKRTV